MGKVKKYGVWWHSNFWLLFPGFSAITLFGHVFMRKPYDVMLRYLDTYSAQITGNHEKWHIKQKEDFSRTSWIGFYITYLGYWIRNWFKYPKKAYYMIPFEREAYEKQYTSPDGKVSEWKKYI